ncbi:hypothetical protein SCALM49S_05399 [Streptomyces californicus]
MWSANDRRRESLVAHSLADQGKVVGNRRASSEAAAREPPLSARGPQEPAITTGRATPAEAACTDAPNAQRAPAPDTACADAPNACAVAPPAAALGGPVSHAVSRVARLHQISGGQGAQGGGPLPRAGAADDAPVGPGGGPPDGADQGAGAGSVHRHEDAPATGADRARAPPPDPADRRAVLVEATDDSCALHTAVETAWGRLEEQTLAGLETAERDELVRLLAKVEENLSRRRTDRRSAPRRSSPMAKVADHPGDPRLGRCSSRWMSKVLPWSRPSTR